LGATCLAAWFGADWSNAGWRGTVIKSPIKTSTNSIPANTDARRSAG
jgi:hypothetical protein